MNTDGEVYSKLHTQDADVSKRLHNLKSRHARKWGKITGFITEVWKFSDTTALEDCEYYNDKLCETLGRLTSLDDEVHKLLDESEYDVDVKIFEEYIDSAKRTILRTSRQMEGHLEISTRDVTITDAHEEAAPTAPSVASAMIRLHRSSSCHFLET
jgi:hypothetical protein